MKQYCRYCSNCIAQDEDFAVCEVKNEMVKKTYIRNTCKYFSFCEIDAFYFNRSNNPKVAIYKPREATMKQCAGQITFTQRKEVE